jgi:3-deoxy-manno-octulosonate cytidylyltransferase (CMP-KDO synthetase)
MTGQHENGTMRCAEAANILSLNDKDYVIDIQGDEPLLHSDDVEIVVNYIHNNACEIVIPHFMIDKDKNYSVVKIVESNNQILYMSRHSIPYGALMLKKHVDFIGFTQKSLQKYAKLSQTYNEQAEKIELMRAIDHGMDVKTVLVNNENIAVNTVDDVDKVRDMFKCMK